MRAAKARRVLVVATDDEGVSREVTAEVTFQATGASVEANHTVKGNPAGNWNFACQLRWPLRRSGGGSSQGAAASS